MDRWVTYLKKNQQISVRKTGIDRQREVDSQSEGSGPAEAAVRQKARRKALGNTPETYSVYPPWHYTQNYEGAEEIHQFI